MSIVEEYRAGRRDFRGANLRGVDLSGADLRWADLSWVDLSGSTFRGADLRGVNLSGANLRGSDLSGCRLNWQSHDLVAEMLRRWADGDVQRRALAGIVLVSTDLCWRDFASMDISQRDDALAYLRTLVREGDRAPKELVG